MTPRKKCKQCGATMYSTVKYIHISTIIWIDGEPSFTVPSFRDECKDCKYHTRTMFDALRLDVITVLVQKYRRKFDGSS